MEPSLLWTALIVFAQICSFRFFNPEGVLSGNFLVLIFLSGIVVELLQLWGTATTSSESLIFFLLLLLTIFLIIFVIIVIIYTLTLFELVIDHNHSCSCRGIIFRIAEVGRRLS